MTTKKIVLIVLAIVIVLGLIVVVVAGAIMGFVFYQIGNSDAAEVARNFLKTNDKLKQDIGEVKEFGKFITGNINVNSGNGTATLNLKVVGELKTVNASVELVYQNNRPWRVIQASYQNEAGQTIELLNPYESRTLTLRMAA
jgi:flagellar basal body-associated protein FliL